MKYMIVPAKDLQSGDVLFKASPGDPNVEFCGRVLGMNVPERGSSTVEFRVAPIVGSDSEGHTVLEFDHGQLVGVAREDAYVDVDVAGLLASLEDEP